jgi:hypothetical protein
LNVKTKRKALESTTQLINAIKLSSVIIIEQTDCTKKNDESVADKSSSLRQKEAFSLTTFGMSKVIAATR